MTTILTRTSGAFRISSAFLIIILCIFLLTTIKTSSNKSVDVAHQRLTSSRLHNLWERKEFEVPNQPSTRTGFSSKQFEQLLVWLTYQERLRRDVSRIEGVNVLFYGDRITESLSGTSYGSACDGIGHRCSGISEMFQYTLKDHNLTSHVSAISGDRTQHLLWRLTEGGEVPSTIHPDVVVVLIGTNNIAQNSAESIALGIQDIVDVLQKALPSTTILVNEIFPRQDSKVVTDVGKHIDLLNALLTDYFTHDSEQNKSAGSRKHNSTDDSFVHFLQCGQLFKPTQMQLAKDKNTLVNVDLMPDKLHPGAMGMKIWLTECILPHVLAAINTKNVGN